MLVQVVYCGAKLSSSAHTFDFSCNLLSAEGAALLCDMLQVALASTPCLTPSHTMIPHTSRDAVQPLPKLRILSLADNPDIGCGNPVSRRMCIHMHPVVCNSVPLL